METLDNAYALLDQGHLTKAERAFRELLKHEPDNPRIHWGLGRLATLANEPAAAAHHYAHCCQALPGEPQPLIALGESLVALHEFERAETTFREVAKQHPASAAVRYALGFFLVGKGDFDSARSELDEAIRIQPDHLPAHQVRSRVMRFTPGCPELAALAALAGSALKPGQRLLCEYALAKAMDDLGQYDQAAEHLARANELQLEACDYRAADMAGHFASIRDTFTRELLMRQAPAVPGAPDMLFIVGLPRSGSTLLEQCLGRHSAIASAGESHSIGSQVGNAIHAISGQAFPLGCGALAKGQLEELARLYYSKLPRACQGARVVIDKMPANFQAVGLIHMLLPNATIVHVERDPMDTAFSIYRNYFSQAEPFFCGQEDIARYSGYCRDTMAHWDQVLPGKVIHLSYETLASNPEATLRSLLGALGLAWEDEVLAPGAGSYVGTLSDTQVREAIDGPRHDHWRHYEAGLGTLLDAFRD